MYLKLLIQFPCPDFSAALRVCFFGSACRFAEVELVSMQPNKRCMLPFGEELWAPSCLGRAASAHARTAHLCLSTNMSVLPRNSRVGALDHEDVGCVLPAIARGALHCSLLAPQVRRRGSLCTYQLLLLLISYCMGLLMRFARAFAPTFDEGRNPRRPRPRV